MFDLFNPHTNVSSTGSFKTADEANTALENLKHQYKMLYPGNETAAAFVVRPIEKK